MQALIDKAKKIRLMIFDVDGILTNGFITFTCQGHEHKQFHVHDGQGLKLLMESGIEIGIITARHSSVVKRRMDELGVKYVYQGNGDKLPAYEELKTKLQLTDEEIAYMGDDLPDLPMLRRVGLAITVPNAPTIIQKHAHMVTRLKGGKGAAREVCDFILEAQGAYQQVIDKFLSR